MSIYREKFNEVRPLGKGGFSTVFEAISLSDSRSYAIKKIPFSIGEQKKTLQEINILKTLNSDFVVQYIDSWIDVNYYINNTCDELDPRCLLFDTRRTLLLHIQMELCSMTLNKFIKSLNYIQINTMTVEQFSVICKIFSQLLNGIKYLHDHNPPIIHRDLKPENIMISGDKDNFIVKLADFGLSTYHTYLDESHTKYIGTKLYRAPELNTRNYDTKSDIYSLGLIMGEMFNMDVNRVKKKVDLKIKSNYDQLFEICTKCFSHLTIQRPTCGEILETKNLWHYSEEMSKDNNKMIHNIILIGESGSGKSTFINAFANYLTYDSLEQAKQNDLKLLAGTLFMHSDNEGKINTIITREDDNETSKKLGESATQHCKSYRFNFSNGVSIRLIDTPGTSDTRGTAQDFINFENTMKIIDACGNITAFCIVMKCDHSRMNIAFKECLGKLFLQLHQNIKKNIMFIFTYGKGTNYSAVPAIALVNKFLSDEKIGLKLTEENALCIENDTFNHLVLTKRNLKSNITQSVESWLVSSKVCAQFVQHIFKLEPTNVRDIISINNTRQLLDKLPIELVEVLQHINYNLKLIEERKKEVEKSKTVSELEKLKASPDLNFERVKLAKPKLICTSNKCTTLYNNTTCCPDCGPLKHLLSHGSFVKFKARHRFGVNYCSNCECVERDHRIVQIETRVTGTKGYIEIENSKLKNEKDLQKQLLLELEERHNTYMSERHSIIKALAQFYYYLKENSMVKNSDFFKNFTREKLEVFEIQRDSKQSDECKNVLELYKSEKEIFKNSLKLRTTIMVSFQDLDNLKRFLCKMKYNGVNIRKIYELLDTSFEGQEIIDEISLNITSFQL